MKALLSLSILLTTLSVQAGAAVLNFEIFDTPYDVLNVNPNRPYREAGYTLTPATAFAAVFGYQSPVVHTIFQGDDTSFFGFLAGNVITLTGPGPFDLNSALMGLTDYGAAPGNVDFIIVGNFVGGGTAEVRFNNLSTATEEAIGLRNLQSATFAATNAPGLDNISVTASVPEPSYFLLAAAFPIAIALVRSCQAYPITSHSSDRGRNCSGWNEWRTISRK